MPRTDTSNQCFGNSTKGNTPCGHWVTKCARCHCAELPGRVIDPTIDKFVSAIVCTAHTVFSDYPNQLIENGLAC